MQKVFGCVPVTSGELKPELGRYRAPKARLALLRKRGELIPLRRNLYLCNPESYSPELIANRLIEPSYLSYETVLSACGIIPERVYSIRSSCLKRGRSFDNATGHYEYIRVPRAYYPEGVTIRKTEQGLCYLSATPEKALCDLILATSGLRLQSPKAAREYLEIFLRADMDEVAAWDADLIHNLALLSDKKKDSLFNLERMLRREFPCCGCDGGDEEGRARR
ncbi:MAG: hypothetical protein ACI4PY_06690 [Akkermansia muciniphila]